MSLEEALEKGDYKAIIEFNLESIQREDQLVLEGIKLDALNFQGKNEKAVKFVRSVEGEYLDIITSRPWQAFRFELAKFSFQQRFTEITSTTISNLRHYLHSFTGIPVPDIYGKWKSRGFHSLGNYYLLSGELYRAEQVFLKALDLRETLQDRAGIAFTSNKLALIRMYHGHIIEARQLVLKTIEIYTELGNKQAIATAQRTLASLARQEGDLSKAIELYNRCLVYFRELENPFLLSHTLFDLYAMVLDHEPELAEEVFQELNSINTSNVVINQIQEGSKIIKLAASRRGRDKYKAQELLEDHLKSDIIFEIRSFLVLKYISLLIDELKAYNENEVLVEIVEQIEEEKIYAEKNNAVIFHSKLSILEAQFVLLKGATTEAFELIETIIEKAEDQQLLQVENEAKEVKDRMNEMIKFWKQKSDQSLSIIESSALSDMENYLKAMVEKFNL